jgi:GGDEF domain-containing protein
MQVPGEEKTGDRSERFYMDLARIVRKHTREEDMVGKNNGEIGILLPETDETGSKALVERLLNIIHADSQFKSDGGLKSYVEALSFQSFTFPSQFSIPESLRAILKDIDEETLPH